MISYSELWDIQEPLIAMAAVLDGYLRFSGRIKQWKSLTVEWWVNLQLVYWRDRYEISKRFLEVLHAIYGHKILSARRLISSFLSSLVFLLFFYWLLVVLGRGFYEMPSALPVAGNPYFEAIGYTRDTLNWLHPLAFFAVIFDAIGVNFLPDFLSLAETGWIIGLACRRGSSLMFLVLVDFVLTTGIWMISALIAITYGNVIKVGELLVPTFHQFLSYYDLGGGATLSGGSSPALLAFALTTYSTSLLWILFLTVVIIFAVLKRGSRVVVGLLETKWVAELPFVLVIGIPCLLSWPILFLLKMVG